MNGFGERRGGRVQKNGASDEIRTHDSHLGKVMLYQLSYTRIVFEDNKTGVTDRQDQIFDFFPTRRGLGFRGDGGCVSGSVAGDCGSSS